LREAAKSTLKSAIAERMSIGDGNQNPKGGSSSGSFEVAISALVRGLRPFQVQGLSIDGSTWTLIKTVDGVPKEEIKRLVFESPDQFSAIRLYDPISGVYSNVFRLT
jgi:hypothetical protein